MAEALYSEQIRYLGETVYVEEREHEDLVCCKTGALYSADLYFSGCSTVGDYWKWKKEPKNRLSMRYWNEKPTKEERKNTPWKPYLLHRKGSEELLRITEEEFVEIKEKHHLKEREKTETEIYLYSDTVEKFYFNEDNSIEVLLVKN